MSLLFLDIDGVINSEDFYRSHLYPGNPDDMDEMFMILQERPKWHVDNIALARIKKVCEDSNSSIVISSTWRSIYNKDDFIRIFDSCGWSNAPIIDVTPMIDGGIRGDEVRKWMNDHHCTDTYVIIDDAEEFYPEQSLYRTDFKHGFTA